MFNNTINRYDFMITCIVEGMNFQYMKTKLKGVWNVVGGMLLFAFLLLPLMAFFNLNATSSQPADTPSSVLGETKDDSSITVITLQPDKSVFVNIDSRITDENMYILETDLIAPRRAGVEYRSKLLHVRNNTQQNQVLKVRGYFKERSASLLTFSFGSEKYPLSTPQHREFVYQLDLSPYEELDLWFAVQSERDVNFPDHMVIELGLSM